MYERMASSAVSKMTHDQDSGITELTLTWVILGDPRHRVERREITVETEADCFEVSGVADGAPGAAAAAPGAGWGAAPAKISISVTQFCINNFLRNSNE